MFSELWNFLSRFIDDFTVSQYIGALVALLLGMYSIWHILQNNLKEETTTVIDKHLDSDKNIQSYIDSFRSATSYHPSLYRSILQTVLDFLDRHLGERKLFSYKTFNKHLSYSLIYSFLFFYLSWLLGSDGKIGNISLFESDDRFFITVILLLEVVILVTLFHEKTHDTIDALLCQIPILRKQKTLRDLVVVVVVGVGVGSIFFLFFLLLPFINTIFDYISMYASRYFLENIIQTDNKSKVFVDTLADIVIAVLLLLSLAWTLEYVITFMNIHLIEKKEFFVPVAHYKELLLENPIDKEVLWITMMFVSTLIPTFAHIYLAIIAFLGKILAKPHIHTLIAQLEKILPDSPRLEKENIAKDIANHRLLQSSIIYYSIMAILAISFVVVLSMLLAKKGL